MATTQSFLVCDSSTLTNFKQWAQAISVAFSTFGWVQSSDTGQVNWSTISSVPGSGAFVYEIWQPNDGLTTFYVKIQYGNVSGTNCPSLILSLSSTTNGAGVQTGLVTQAYNTNLSAFTIPSTTTQYECNFSGASGRIGVMMWRNGINLCQQFFAIERSVNSSGVYIGTYVTLVVVGYCSAGFSGQYPAAQQSLVFGIGAGPAIPNATRINTIAYGTGINVRVPCFGLTSNAFNGVLAVDMLVPHIGFLDYPLTTVGAMFSNDFAEGVPFQITLYGSLRTYMPSKAGHFGIMFNTTSPTALAMRYD